MTPVEFFSDYIFRMVFWSSLTIGSTAGALGAFAYLRKQSLVGDVVSHSGIFGVMGAFLFSTLVLGIDGRNMTGLIIGAFLAGTLSIWLAGHITRNSRIKIDSTMAIMLALFFGGAMVLLRVITNSGLPNQGGLQDYLFGNAAIVTRSDLAAILTFGALALLTLLALYKEFKIFVFDPQFTHLLGFRTRLLEPILLATIVLAVVIGLKTMGLILMVAFLVSPAAAARQWTRSVGAMTALSAGFGGLGAVMGAYLSIAFGGVATGPVIVLVLFAIVVVSLLFAPKRSVFAVGLARRRQRRALRARLETESHNAPGLQSAAEATQ